VEALMMAFQKEYQVGAYRILLPGDHPLDDYQRIWRRYDTALGYVAKFVFQKYPDRCAIDIGANVGDSAALIRSHAKVPVLCIEGNPEFQPYLKHNASLMGGIEIENCFVGDDGLVVDLKKIVSGAGTASVSAAVDSKAEQSAPVRSLHKILESEAPFRRAKLLKTDTDGSDFSILRTSAPTISRMRPVLHFEYDTAFKADGDKEAMAAVRALFDIGYRYFLVYDNFGNYVVSMPEPELDRFIDLNACLASNRTKSGTRVIYYFDICALTSEDEDLFRSIRDYELEIVRC
jgi:FkbM family methyltransferase